MFACKAKGKIIVSILVIICYPIPSTGQYAQQTPPHDASQPFSYCQVPMEPGRSKSQGLEEVQLEGARPCCGGLAEAIVHAESVVL